MIDQLKKQAGVKAKAKHAQKVEELKAWVK